MLLERIMAWSRLLNRHVTGWLVGPSLALMLAVIFAHQSWSGSERLSLFIALSPFIVLAWLACLASLTLFERLRAPALCSVGLCLALGLVNWPVGWLFRAERPATPPPQLRLTTWNVERLGELDISERRGQTLEERLRCVGDAIEDMDSQLLVIQEISARRVKALERLLNLRCEHVDYHGVGGSRRGGLATCARLDGPWQISQARDFSLGGDWRALFVEVKARQGDPNQRRFNVLNVHFSPNKLGARDLKQVAKALAHGSVEALFSLLRQLAQNMKKQEDQVEGLIKAINTLSDPSLVAGDFNAPPYTSLHRAFAKAGDGAWVDTWSDVGVSFGATRYLGGWIPLRIDYIYALRRGFELGSVRVSDAECSDHRALHLRAELLNSP